MDRRSFGRICLLGAAAAFRSASPALAQPPPSMFLTRYNRVLLTGATGQPLSARGVDLEEDYIFFYPLASTPCLLLDLGRPVPATEVAMRGPSGGYAWSGGVGPQRSVVAFTAICPHEWAHPDKTFSPIHYYRAGEKATLVSGRDRLIVCCVHGSAFDPVAGGLVEQGPAEIPLAIIALEWDQARDQIFASGLLGLDSFDRFFRGFKGKSRTPVEGQTTVMRLREYSAAVARC